MECYDSFTMCKKWFISLKYYSYLVFNSSQMKNKILPHMLYLSIENPQLNVKNFEVKGVEIIASKN